MGYPIVILYIILCYNHILYIYMGYLITYDYINNNDNIMIIIIGNYHYQNHYYHYYHY
jgi:hypothetical protein